MAASQSFQYCYRPTLVMIFGDTYIIVILNSITAILPICIWFMLKISEKAVE